MGKGPAEEYLEKARKLTKEEAERIFARMRGKFMRRMEDREATPVEAVAFQLEKEDKDLEEWRARWAEISARDQKKEKRKKESK